jgi:predicted DNA-binding antitoxin AbrB/MazE fold protein
MLLFGFDFAGGFLMNGLEVEAVYERGILKLSRELPLQEGQKVTITIHPSGASQRFCGSVRWTGDPEELRRFLDDLDESQWG